MDWDGKKRISQKEIIAFYRPGCMEWVEYLFMMMYEENEILSDIETESCTHSCEK